MEALRRIAANIEDILGLTTVKEPLREERRVTTRPGLKPVEARFAVSLTGQKCPKCGKPLVDHLRLRAPLLSSASGFRLMVEIVRYSRCSKCQYTRVSRKMLLPVEVLETLKPLMVDDARGFVDNVSNVSREVRGFLEAFKAEGG